MICDLKKYQFYGPSVSIGQRRFEDNNDWKWPGESEWHMKLFGREAQTGCSNSRILIFPLIVELWPKTEVKKE